jgi:DNA processing protein
LALRLNYAGVRHADARALLAALGDEQDELAFLASRPFDERLERAKAFRVEEELERAEKLGISLLFRDDPGYSDWLNSVEDAPLVLYGRGSPIDATGLAVVGSRRPTPYGLRMARRIAGELAEAGLAVVSGLARGIDAEAHEAALAAGGATWAILGSGLAKMYPSEHARLADRIVDSGGWVASEFCLDMPPLGENFPRRNRVVSGLCWATIVVEGRLKSGSLITAKAALKQGREVFAVPGPFDSPLSEAPHALIGDGAAIWKGLAGLREAMPPGVRLAKEQEKILEFIGSEAPTVETLARELGLPLARLSGWLMELEIMNLIKRVEGQRYAKS